MFNPGDIDFNFFVVYFSVTNHLITLKPTLNHVKYFPFKKIRKADFI